MTQDAKTQRMKYRSHSSITTERLVFTGYDFNAYGGPVKAYIVDLNGLDTNEAYNMAKSLRDWCDRVIWECGEEWAAETQLALFEGA